MATVPERDDMVLVSVADLAWLQRERDDWLFNFRVARTMVEALWERDTRGLARVRLWRELRDLLWTSDPDWPEPAVTGRRDTITAALADAGRGVGEERP